MAKPVLAIDIGGSKIAAALIYSDGEVKDYVTVETDRRGGQYVVRQILDMAAKYGVGLGGMGISIPGIVKDGIVVWAPNIRGWRNLDLGGLVAKRLKIPVLLIDDRTANVVGEAWLGEAKGADNAASLIIGTGVGLGAIVNGIPLTGHSDVFGAIGWWLLDTRPRDRSRRGYLEESISGPALVRNLRRRCLRARDTACLDFLRGCGATGECVFKASDSGIKLADEVLKRAALLVGIAVANVVSILNPKVLVLGGSVGIALGSRYLDYIRDEASRIAQPYAFSECEIRVSKLGHLANLYGAAKMVLDTLSVK